MEGEPDLQHNMSEKSSAYHTPYRSLEENISNQDMTVQILHQEIDG